MIEALGEGSIATPAAAGPRRTYGALSSAGRRGGAAAVGRRDSKSSSSNSHSSSRSTCKRHNGRIITILVGSATALAGAAYWSKSRHAPPATTVGITGVDATEEQLVSSRLPQGPETRIKDSLPPNLNSKQPVGSHLAEPKRKSLIWDIFGDLPNWASPRGAAHQPDPSDAEVDSRQELDFTVTNFYFERDGPPGARIPWLQGVKLAEPFRDTALKVVNPRPGHVYNWQIRSIDHGSPEELLMETTGMEAEVVFTRLDRNVITLMEVDSETGHDVREKTDTVMVKYVRREIRTLTDHEREELLDAMATMWRVKVRDGPGKELYGEHYQDIWALNRLHFKAGGERECDHFHAGLGFLASHALLTNTFERSLQSVNPKLTVPYWDFTIEASQSAGSGTREPQKESPILTAQWFGSHDPQDYMVKNGRWAFTQIPLLDLGNPGRLDADVYGKLRSPWNVNSRPYLSRGMGELCGMRMQDGHPWPTCKEHYELSTEHNSFYSWVWASMFGPHGGIHAWIGGVLDCDDLRLDLIDLVGQEMAKIIVPEAFIHRKTLYRQRIFACDGRVGVGAKPDELFSSGKCGCLGYNLDEGDDYQIILKALSPLDEDLAKYPVDAQRGVARTLCNKVMTEGDHLQSSSSLDPTFWLTHPTLERLWMFKRLSGTMIDLDWPDNDVKGVNESGEEYYVKLLSHWVEDCNGHRGSDVFPYSLLDNESPDFKVSTAVRVGGQDSGERGNTLTNRNVLELIDARVNSLDYIYDNFEWNHCAEDGYDLHDILRFDGAASPPPLP